MSKPTPQPKQNEFPPIDSLMRNRIVRVVGEASGQRALIESIEESSRKLRDAVKQINLAELSGQLFRSDGMQLDIFDDSHGVMLRNDVLNALQRYAASEARQALQKLADEFPDVDGVSLLATLEHRSTMPFADHPGAAQARHALAIEVKTRSAAHAG